MKINHIKAPQHLKSKTIFLMEKELNHKTKRTPVKVAIIAACIPVLFILTAFAYSLFSGISGDELSFSTEYKGNGIVEVSVENLSEKKLQFTDVVKLKQWSTAEKIFSIEQEMPLIRPGETEVITIDLSDYDTQLLETPLIKSDWYYFVFTNNNFLHGHDWMATVTFADPIAVEQSGLETEITLPSEKPQEDNTSEDDVATIKSNFTLQKPLKEFIISSPYNDYNEDGKYVHPETDLVCELEEDIFALSEGIVIESGFDSEIGNYIVIDHGDGLISKYAHCKELFKKQGDSIGMKDVIASVGKTGMATGVHLAFSVTLDGVPINPEHLLDW